MQFPCCLEQQHVLKNKFMQTCHIDICTAILHMCNKAIQQRKQSHLLHQPTMVYKLIY